MELTQKQKGNLTELQCLTAFVEHGLNVSVPYGDNARYDFIIDVSNQLIRVQVKTANIVKGDENAIHFSCKSTYTSSQGVSNVRYTASEIDYFATFWKGKCYLVPISECSVDKTLRFAPPKNGQIKGITFAVDYELEKQLEKIQGGSN